MQQLLGRTANSMFGIELPNDLSGFFPEVDAEVWVPKVSEFLKEVNEIVASAEAKFPESE